MWIKRRIEKEIKENEYLSEYLEEKIVKNRVESSLRWFIEKAVKNKYYFYIFSILNIVWPIATGIVLSLPMDVDRMKVCITILMGMATITAAMLPLMEFHKKWSIYRDQAEGIKRIACISFLNQGEKNEQDSEKEGKDREKDLLQDLEESMWQTHKGWMKIVSSDK